MNENMRKAYSEVDAILELLEIDFVEKIPQRLRDFLKEKKDVNYVVNINPNLPLEEQQLLSETICILALIKLDYWCENENEKQELLNLFNNNEMEFQRKLEERYSSEKIFSNNNNQLPTMDKKNSLIDKILNFICKIFRRNI